MSDEPKVAAAAEEPLEAAAPRREWTAPEMRRLATSSAEAGVNLFGPDAEFIS